MALVMDAYAAETPGGDTYGRGVGHAVMPDGSLIALWQGSAADELNAALVRAVWDEWQEVGNVAAR